MLGPISVADMLMRSRLLDVLRYTMKLQSRGTIRRHYLKWRAEHKMPVCCDNEECRFHRERMIWNGEPLPFIVDHRNGNNSDNRPENLRLLCPNCDSQLETRGGRNRGRVEKSEGGFAVVRRDGKKDYILPAEHVGISRHAPTVRVREKASDS